MKKLLLLATVLMFAVGAASAQDSKKWYVSTTLQGNYNHVRADVGLIEGKDTYHAEMLTVGVAINRMIGDNSSAGLGVEYGYSSASVGRLLGVELGFAHFTKLLDRFYYVVELGGGIMFDKSKGIDSDGNLMCGITPVGFEFRPGRKEKIGLRLNLLSLGYMEEKGKMLGTSFDATSLTVSAMPVFSVNWRF